MSVSAHARADWGAAYVPRIVLRHLHDDPAGRVRTVDGTCVFVDISGFTRLSEQLARRGGREGAEMLADTIGACFESLLRVAYDRGGALLKFGGDALLLLFEGEDHVARACRSAIDMRACLRAEKPIKAGGAPIRLRMSVGVHSGSFVLSIVGSSHRELLVPSPAATQVVLMEKEADAGEIVISPATAAALAPRHVGEAKGPGRLLAGAPEVPTRRDDPDWQAAPETVGIALSTGLREHVLAGPQPPEHRVVTVAFIKLSGTDALVAEHGPEALADALEELVEHVQDVADDLQVCFLGSDIDADGGKLILTAGAPRAHGDEEERMLLAARRIADGAPELPIRIGVHRGALFAGDIGPWYRRTYTVMGDVVNVAARLMAQAPPGAIYVSTATVAHSPTRFETLALPPLTVKGKSKPLEAFALGPVIGRRGRTEVVPIEFPLIGREREVDELERALDDASRGRGRLVELVSEPGMGKTRLMEEVRDRAEEVRILHATCEAYSAATPYALARELLRKLLGLGLEDTDELAGLRLRRTVEADDPGLLPWLPLLGIAAGATVPDTPEVAQLAPEFRAARLHEAVLRFLRRQLPSWALIEVEDAHFMDEASAQLIAALERELPLLPWLVVITRRDRDTGFVAEPAPHVLRLDLAPLAPADVLQLAELVTESAPLPPHMVALAAERSGGSPQFLRDLLRAASSGSTELPESIEAAALARLDRIAPADRALVRRASVLGTSFHERHLEALLDDGARIDDGDWDRLAPYFTLDGEGHRRFRRQVVRDVAYAGMPFRERRRLHAAAAALLEAELGPFADEQAERLSLHHSRAGELEPAWRYAGVAADRALARAAYADAATLYQRALDAGRRLHVGPAELAGMWERLAEALVRTGELRESAAALTTARRLVADDPVWTAHLLWQHSRIAERVGDVPQAVRWAWRAQRALDGADGLEAVGLRAHVLATLAGVRQRQGRAQEAIGLAQEAIALAETSGEQLALGHACQMLDWALVRSGRAAELGHSARALEIFRRHGAADRESAVLNNMGGFAYLSGRWDEAVELYEQGAEAASRAGDVDFAAFADCNVGELRSDQGRLEEAEPRLRRALQVWRGTSDAHGAAFATALLGRLHVRSGRVDEGAGLLREAGAAFEALRAEFDAATVEGLLAEAALFAGQPDEALALVDELAGRLPADAPLDAHLRHVRGIARAQLGDGAGAAHELAAAAAAARAAEQHFELVLALDALTVLDGAGASPHRRERDALVARMDIVRIPTPKLPGTTLRSGF
jgi:class 3 adenylate cyclase/tetratricopeptide (TPR) repeat protein